MRVILESRHSETANIVTHFFRPERPMHYTAGQFIELTIQHANPDNRGTKRWFTLSSSPTDELLTITTKFATEHGSTFKQALRDLTLGAQLEMSEPMGDFVLPKDASRPLVFVAGGIGLTPFHSMASWLTATHEKRNIQFLYSVRTESEIVFQDVFMAAGIRPTVIISEPSSTWSGKTGQLNASTILGFEKPAENTLIYISGPEPMTESLEAELKATGIKETQLVLDFFPGYEDLYSH